MAAIQKFELEIEMKSPADALWNTVKDMNELYPKLFPDILNIDLLHGDGRSAGTVRVINFATDEHYLGKTQKSKIEYVDDEKKVIAYLLLKGRPMKFYKYFQELYTVKEMEEGSLMAWTCMYQKRLYFFPDPYSFKDTMIDIFHKLDAYTLAKL